MVIENIVFFRGDQNLMYNHHFGARITYIHKHKVYSGLSIKQLNTIQRKLKNFHLLPICLSNKTQSGFVYIIEAPDIFFPGKDEIGRLA